MAITYVSCTPMVTGVNGSISVAIPVGYAAGDLLILVTHGETAVPTLPSGWTALYHPSTIRPYMRVCYKFATASESSVIITAGEYVARGFMLCFRGVDTTNPMHKTSSGNNEITTSGFISLTINPTIPNCMLVFISCFSDNGSTPDNNNYSGWTTYSGLSGITEVIDNATSDGSYDKGGFACAYGLQTSAAYVDVNVMPDYIPHTFHYFVMALTQGEPPLSISIKVGSVWKDGTPFVKVGGVWKPVEKIYEKIGGVWKS